MDEKFVSAGELHHLISRQSGVRFTLAPDVEAILFEFIGGRLLDWLPGWLLRRFVKLDAIASRVSLGTLHLEIGLTEATPCLRVYLQVVNHSGLDVVLDRVTLDVWAG